MFVKPNKQLLTDIVSTFSRDKDEDIKKYSVAISIYNGVKYINLLYNRRKYLSFDISKGTIKLPLVEGDRFPKKRPLSVVEEELISTLVTFIGDSWDEEEDSMR